MRTSPQGGHKCCVGAYRDIRFLHVPAHCGECCTSPSPRLASRATFITPFDQADIQSLITSMDDSVDQCKATAKAIMLFEMTNFEPDMRKMADAVVDCSELAQRAVVLLSNVAKNAAALNEICLQITRIEGDADDTHDRGLELLYQKAKGGDALEFIRGSEIYKHLEDTVDSLDDVADEIQGIVIEHV